MLSSATIVASDNMTAIVMPSGTTLRVAIPVFHAVSTAVTVYSPSATAGTVIEAVKAPEPSVVAPAAGVTLYV